MPSGAEQQIAFQCLFDALLAVKRRYIIKLRIVAKDLRRHSVKRRMIYPVVIALAVAFFAIP